MSLPGDISNEEIDARIRSTLGAVYRASGYEPVERSTPLSELLAKEAGWCVDERGQELSVAEVRAEAFRWWTLWLFEKGFDPRVVVQRCFAVAKELAPSVIADMPEEAMALLLGDGGRATVNARGKAVMLGLKRALGVKTEVGTHRKGAGARARMSAAQRGNRNRAAHASLRRAELRRARPERSSGEAALSTSKKSQP